MTFQKYMGITVQNRPDRHMIFAEVVIVNTSVALTEMGKIKGPK